MSIVYQLDSVSIIVIRRQITIDYAADELCKYICLMAGNKNAANISKSCLDNDGGIKLGLFSDFILSTDEFGDPEKDDAICIDINESSGFIAGSNPRSVLFGVYRFLESNGCLWLHPGKDGETVPLRNTKDLKGHIFEKAFSRFRGNNNCGAYSLEHILDKIEWMPKVGLNTFLIEFFLPKDMLNQWYNHEYHSYMQPQRQSDIELAAYNRQTIAAIKQRGLILQSVGHGWTGAFFDFSESDSSTLGGSNLDYRKIFDKKSIDDQKQYLALINAKREFGIRGSKHTELCYGNSDVRKRMIQCVAKYAEAHPEVDILHFWMSDQMNAHCECGLCCDTRPSDFYVMMLNGMDKEFLKRGLRTRIAFIIYQDLLWFPEKEDIINPDRFVMVFAPIGRNYKEAYDTYGDESSFKQYVRNRNVQPSEIKGFITALNGWRKHFQGEAFAFDYHMTRYHYFDQGYYGFTKVMEEDIRKLPMLGLNGFVSCQIIRTYFPTGYPVFLHARLLWNPQENIDSLADKYFEGCFGSDGRRCLEYFKALSDMFIPDYFYRYNLEPCSENSHIAMEKLMRLPDIIRKFKPIIERNMKCDNRIYSQSWDYLFIHAEIALLLADALRAKIEGRQKVANAYWTKVVENIMANESRIQSVFDSCWFFSSFEKPKLFELENENNFS